MKVNDDCKCREEKYAEKFFASNGYNFRCVNRCKSKSTYRVEKDGFEMTWVLMRTKLNMTQHMRMFEELFEAKKGN